MLALNSDRPDVIRGR